MRIKKNKWNNKKNTCTKENQTQHIFCFADSTLAATETASESSGTGATAHQDTGAVSPSNPVWDLNAY